ncbi:MAG: hypothetical protein HYX96_05710 [Chloroflexi bacterium]|nr:hypothetical protein [Chloroflexota bacterium]
MRYALESTVTDLGAPGRDDTYGWGLLDASAAVNASLPGTGSYRDAGLTQVSDNFTDYDTENTVYLTVSGLLPGESYRMTFYDGSGARRVTAVHTASASGILTAQRSFVLGTDLPGDWHAVVSTPPVFEPPAEYDPAWSYALSVTGFTVQMTAIPEFPAYLSALVSLGLAAGFYLWMRRGARHAHA